MKKIATQKSYNKPVCTCPHCDSTSLIRSGFDRGTQRYRCKNCKKTFKATAGTPVHGLHKKGKIAKYIKALQKGMSVRKAAEYVGISKNTSFVWRHKFLSSLETSSLLLAKSSVTSVMLIQVEYSAKGRRKPPEKHRSSTKTIALFREGQLELHKLKQIKHTKHASKIFSETTANFFVATPHKTITAGIRYSENAIIIKNQLISRQLIAEIKQHTAILLNWMERFRGVASKYLQNYWNWYASLFNLGEMKQETEHFYRLCTDRRSLEQYFSTKQQ